MRESKNLKSGEPHVYHVVRPGVEGVEANPPVEGSKAAQKSKQEDMAAGGARGGEG